MELSRVSAAHIKMKPPSDIKKINAIRDAIIAHCEYRDGQYYATEQGKAMVQKVLDDFEIPGIVTIGDDGKFLVTVRVLI